MKWQFLKMSEVFGNLALSGCTEAFLCICGAVLHSVGSNTARAETPQFGLMQIELSWHWRIHCAPTTLSLRPLEWWPGLKILLLKSQYGTIWKLKISNLQNYFLVLNLYSTDVAKS